MLCQNNFYAFGNFLFEKTKICYFSVLMERLKELQKKESDNIPPPKPMYHPDHKENTTSNPAPKQTSNFQLPPGGASKRSKRKISFSELPWSDYFTERRSVAVRLLNVP